MEKMLWRKRSRKGAQGSLGSVTMKGWSRDVTMKVTFK